ncbi:MAG: adenine phosphoribosyltransferase [Rhodobacteraceae bacterium]|nr:adenine phosphoribosyltransferase [Paracoccaceae bacterium]
MPTANDIKDYIRTIPDFPKPGIMFRDVTTLFKQPRGLRIAVDQLLHPWSGSQIEKVAALEARGFVIGGAVAHQISAGFVLIRKRGKLPGRTLSESYELEYGSEIMEIHDDAVMAGEKVLLVDDLLATGGTAIAGIHLLERLGAEIAGCAFIINLPALGGRQRLEEMGMQVHCLCEFDGD